VAEVDKQPGALPLLQYALTELFEQPEARAAPQQPSLLLTHEAYAETGGVAGALARRAEEVYRRLSAEEQGAAQQLFLRLATLGEGVEDTRRRVLQAELEGLATIRTTMPSADGEFTRETSTSSLLAVMSAFGKYRLLTFDRDPISHGPTVEVAHEALLRAWPRLREWLAASRASVRLQRQLAAAALEWESSQHDPVSCSARHDWPNLRPWPVLARWG
jgi:hypothetical protein